MHVYMYVGGFSELFNSQLQKWCPCTRKYCGVSSSKQEILSQNHNITIKIWKLTFILYCYLIYRPCLDSVICPNYVLNSRRQSKMMFYNSCHASLVSLIWDNSPVSFAFLDINILEYFTQVLLKDVSQRELVFSSWWSLDYTLLARTPQMCSWVLRAS